MGEPQRVATACAWVALGSFATFGAPSGTSAFDLELVKSLVSAPFTGAVNPLFEALFNSLGVVPATYACLMMPSAKGNKSPFPAALRRRELCPRLFRARTVFGDPRAANEGEEERIRIRDEKYLGEQAQRGGVVRIRGVSGLLRRLERDA